MKPDHHVREMAEAHAGCEALVAVIRLRMRDEVAAHDAKEEPTAPVVAARIRNLAQPIVLMLDEVEELPASIPRAVRGDARKALDEIVKLADALSRAT